MTRTPAAVPRAAAPGNPFAREQEVAAAPFDANDPVQKSVLVTLGVAVAALIGVYFNMLWETAIAWEQPMYSHGYLVPAMALGLMWVRRKGLVPATTAEVWMGAGVIALGLGLRIPAGIFDMEPLDRVSFIVALLGAMVLAGGVRLLSWAWLPVLFLMFMYPLPSKLEILLLNKLQKLAAVASAIVLQTLGTGVVRNGNDIIHQGTSLMQVAEVCSGLRMATILSAMAVAMVYFVERPWWDRLTVLLSALPIALMVNVARIVVTGLIFIQVKNADGLNEETAKWIDGIAHDWMGLAMPIAAVGLIYLELAILAKLTVPVETVELRPAGLPGALPTGARK